MLKLVHIAGRNPHGGVFPTVFQDALREIGTLTFVTDGRSLSDEEKLAHLQSADVALTGWGSAPLPASLADDPGALGYVCNVTGTMNGFVPVEIVDSGILVSNWGDTPAIAIAEGAMALLLSVLKDIPAQVLTIRDGGWTIGGKRFGGSLHGATVGVYGCGVIGRRFVELLKPFGAEVLVFDPYCDELPVGCERVDSLRTLFARSQVISVCAGLNDETRGTITAELLSLLPDHGVFVNTARGPIVDQDALFAELESGRLRAGLDVLESESALPEDHPARFWPNCIITAHEINRGWPNDGKEPTRLTYMHQVCLDNLKAFAAGAPIRFEMDGERYRRST